MAVSAVESVNMLLCCWCDIQSVEVAVLSVDLGDDLTDDLSDDLTDDPGVA